jgi:predicted nucleic acid-binding protein
VAVVVVDASVSVKWFVPTTRDELDAAPALALLERIRDGTDTLAAPPHWMAEVAGVLVRLAPDEITGDVAALHALHPVPVDGLEVYETACRLAVSLRHHLFDTLYHAAALLTPGATLVTADAVYYRKAAGIGHILRLADLPL